jgi:PAS domain S-box-containing protein
MTTKVLLVAQQADNAACVVEMLLSSPRADFFIEHVDSVTTGARRLGGNSFDAVLLDLGPAVFDHSEELSLLAAAAPAVPIIVLTETDDENIGAAAVLAGAQDYLVKPRINGDALRRVIRYSGERLRAQRDFERLGHYYETILQAMGDGVLGLDERGRVSFANRTASRLLGRSAGELLGSPIGRLLGCNHFEQGGCQTCFVSGCEKVHAEGETMRLHPSGSAPIECVCTAVRSGDVLDGVVVVFRDATERQRQEASMADHQKQLEDVVAERTQKLSREIADRKRIEAALRESQHRMQSITESLFEGVLVLDAGGNVVFANHSADMLLGETQQTRLAGREIDSVFTLMDGKLPVRFQDGPFRRVAETGTILRDDDAVFQTSGGRSLMVAFACSPLMVAGQRTGSIISFRDICALKKAQQEALQASKLASVGQLAAGIAHEINTPTQYIGDNLRFIGEAFAAICTLLERCRVVLGGDSLPSLATDAGDLLRQAMRDADTDYLVGEIPQAITQSLEGVGQVSRIVLALKEFSHPGERDKVAVDLNRSIENTLAVSKNEWKHVADIELALDPELGQVLCLPGEMNQVLLNLVVNAAHAIDAAQSRRGHNAGKGRISIATFRNGGAVDITIRDNGTGMSEAVRQRIFDPFFTTKDVGKGTGQGLAICRDVVVTKHGGRIEVETEEGRGTLFTITLPLDGDPASIAAAAPAVTAP